jgi:hypothetical protein
MNGLHAKMFRAVAEETKATAFTGVAKWTKSPKFVYPAKMSINFQRPQWNPFHRGARTNQKTSGMHSD